MAAPVVETERLRLRPWRADEAGVRRALWAERDPRVPAHRRLDPAGHPTLDELADTIRAEQASPLGLLAIELLETDEVIGYCGLVHDTGTPDGAPELAFELLRRTWGQGYATEAATAVMDLAAACGHTRLWATVWDWNVASRRLLAALGFTDTGQVTGRSMHGTSLLTTRRL